MNAPQGTHEWLMERVGYVTASRFKDVLAILKNGKPGAAREKYLTEIVCERLTGQPAEHFVNNAMKWGIEQEPAARAAYCLHAGVGVTAVGFLRDKRIKAGASPDGVVDLDYGIEIKCPTSATHLETLLHGMSEDHLPQVQGAMWITGYQEWEFISYDPRMPEHLRLFVQRVKRDAVYINHLAEQVSLFSDEADAIVNQLKERKL
jgi:hypothetical protein